MADCIPTAHGVYFATHRKYGWRSVVLVAHNGLRQTRAFVPRGSASFDVQDFKDWSEALADPGPKGPCGPT